MVEVVVVIVIVVVVVSVFVEAGSRRGYNCTTEYITTDKDIEQKREREKNGRNSKKSLKWSKQFVPNQTAGHFSSILTHEDVLNKSFDSEIETSKTVLAAEMIKVQQQISQRAFLSLFPHKYFFFAFLFDRSRQFTQSSIFSFQLIFSFFCLQTFRQTEDSDLIILSLTLWIVW